MTTRRTILAIAALLCLTSAFTASAQTTQRPFSDWLTPNITAGDTFWFDSENPASPFIFFDFFGHQATVFGVNVGSDIDGTVTETALKNGRADVHVVQHSRSVLSWAFNTGFVALIFGHTAGQVKGGLDAALADTTLTVDFENSAPGAPLPSFFALQFVSSAKYKLERLGLAANADGTLRAAFGVPDGTPGKAHTTQVGLFVVPGMQVNGHDAFPAEKVDIRAVGH